MKTLIIDWDFHETEFMIEDEETQRIQVIREKCGNMGAVVKTGMRIIVKNFPHINKVKIDTHGKGMYIADGIVRQLEYLGITEDEVKVYRFKFIRGDRRLND